jgi:membrane-associated protease RseP (regulator of RpoE activity)
MVSFWIYDVSFLIVFCIGIYWFLRKRKNELSREGWMFMWRTQFGIRAINWIVKRFGWGLGKLKWVVIIIGFGLMSIMLWMLGRSAMIYVLHPEITQTMKAPPIAPLIPYFPKLFGMENMFPDFYFAYFLLALAIVAIFHELFHGLFMKLYNVKIKSTGIVFLGPLLGAFVEQDESSMSNRKRSEQMAILGAGVFANLLIAGLFYLLYVSFFFLNFSAAGFAFNSYAYIDGVPATSIDAIGQDIGEMDIFYSGMILKQNLTEVYYNDAVYFTSTDSASKLAANAQHVDYNLFLFAEAPAILNEIKGAIVEIDGTKIQNVDSLGNFMANTMPGDSVHIVTKYEESIFEYDTVLDANPVDMDRGYLGVAYVDSKSGNILNRFLEYMMDFKDDSTHYEVKGGGEFTYFVYHLLWWIMIINLLVALFNMLPLGILDGGRFLYLGVWSVTNSERFGKWAYLFATYSILLALAVMMTFWFFGVF